MNWERVGKGVGELQLEKKRFLKLAENFGIAEKLGFLFCTVFRLENPWSCLKGLWFELRLNHLVSDAN
jgi:hypothetical protein